MGGASLHDREIDVEQSRAKLTKDLATLCSAKTLSAFTDDLKKEAFDTRDVLWEKIKARAASNPAAVIAIGTGLAWRIFRRPPISSALIGVGLFSLWKTAPRTAYDAMGRRLDYVQHSKESLKEQAERVFAAAVDVADKAQDAVTTKGTGAWAKGKMQEWQEGAGRVVDDTTAKLKLSGERILERAKASGGNLLEDIHAKKRHLRDQMDVLTTNAAQKLQDDDTRNSLLLGIAGAAIAAALGIACQKRIAEMGRE